MEERAAPSSTEDNPRRRLASSALRVLLGLILAFGALAWLVRRGTFDPHQFTQAAAVLGPGTLAVGCAGAMGVVSLQAVRWWFVTRKVATIPYREALASLLFGGFVNVLLPGRAGDVLRVQYMSRHARVSRAALLGSELVDFWCDKCGWLTAFALVAITGHSPSWMLRALAVFLTIDLGLGVAFAWARSRVARRTVPGAPDGWRARLVAGAAANPPRRAAFAALVLGALPWLWETSSLTVVSRIAGMPLSPGGAFALLTAFNMVTIVPVPGNAGLHEAASSFVLVSFGVPLERALAFATAYHASQLLPTLVGGAIGLARRGAKRRLAPAVAPIAQRIQEARP
ncbi:MAG TPA: lysylphosphatidylglycerol synthase transmembrane domain-containing protein [Polyangiaceae bacterium]